MPKSSLSRSHALSSCDNEEETMHNQDCRNVLLDSSYRLDASDNDENNGTFLPSDDSGSESSYHVFDERGSGNSGESNRFNNPPSLSESQSVRLTVAQSVAAAPNAGNRTASRLFVYIQTVFQLPPAISAFCILPFSWSSEYCDQPLFFWALTYAITLLLSVMCSWIIHMVPEQQELTSTQRHGLLRRFVVGLRKPLDNFSLIWILIGQIWLQSSHHCESTAPILSSVCLWLVVLGFCYFLLPCIIIVLLLPFLCFCLPCVIRVVARLFGCTDAFAGKGASSDLIQSLPEKRYHADMFSADGEESESSQCAICLSGYEVGQELRILPCDDRHHFHKHCCDEWLTVNATCPICRYRLDQNEDNERSRSRSVLLMEEGSV